MRWSGAVPPQPRIPDVLRAGPFDTTTAAAAGVTASMLRGRAYRRVFPRVWVLAEHRLGDLDWIHAARLTLPDRAHLTGATRLRLLGLDVGPLHPLRFVVAGDLHLAIDGIMLHRTEVLPPLDADGVTPAAAYLHFCSTSTTIDAIAVGDWLLHRGHLSLEGLAELARRDRWRPGAAEVRWVRQWLRPGSRSLPESRLRGLLAFAGLPEPDVNAEIRTEGELVAIVDLG